MPHELPAEPSQEREADARFAFPDAATPARYQELLVEISQRCDLSLTLVSLDCSEYPCLAWWQVKRDAGAADLEAELSRCKVLTQHQSSGELILREGPAGAFVELLPPEPLSEEQLLRLQERERDMARTYQLAMDPPLGRAGKWSAD